LIVDCLCTTEAFGWVTFMIDKGRLWSSIECPSVPSSPGSFSLR
jgi:hypothetical protein